VIFTTRARFGCRRTRRPPAALVFVVLALVGCAPSSEESSYAARRAALQRQNQGIRELIAQAERGSLVPTDRLLVGVDEKVVGELLRSQLPFDLALGKELVVRLSDATVLLRDNIGRFGLEGEIHRAGSADRRTAVHVTGGLGVVRIDPKLGLLTMSIALDRVELEDGGPLEKVLGPGGKRFVAENARGLLQAALPPLQVPIVFTQDLHVPAFHDGPLQLDSLVVPFGTSVERVLAVEGKLWVTLRAGIGQVSRAGSGLGIDVQLQPKRTGTSSRPVGRAPARAAPESTRRGSPRGQP